MTVTALQPGPTDTEFFDRAGMDDTKVAEAKKDDPAEVAKDGFEALMAGKDHVIAGSVKNKAQVAGGKVLSEKASGDARGPDQAPAGRLGARRRGRLSWGPATLVPMSTPIAQLRGSLDGRVTVPGDAGYDQARKVFYGKWDRRPAVIVRPADAGEVARVVTLAAESGAELARSGGHSLAGHSLSDGGIVLDLGELTALDLDLAARTAWAQTGLTAGAYTEAVGGHGLVTGFGDTASVGIGGLTLGGGWGSWSAGSG